jgi:hypothetical protein
VEPSWEPESTFNQWGGKGIDNYRNKTGRQGVQIATLFKFEAKTEEIYGKFVSLNRITPISYTSSSSL